MKNIVKVFVSHTSADIEHVRLLKSQLESHDKDGRLLIWIYETETEPTRELGKLKFDIEEADFLIVALSNESIKKEFVQRELGHAVRLARKDPDRRPIILGVWVDPAPPPAKLVVPIREFNSKGAFGKYDFGATKYHKLHRPEIDDIAHLYEYLAPRVLFWGRDIADRNTLIKTGAWEIYEKFFPNVEERDDPTDIMGWIEQEYAQIAPDYDPAAAPMTDAERIAHRRPQDWGSVFGIVQIAGRAVGIIYLTVNVRSGWVFGNYFGVLKSWRVNQRAAYFIEQIRAYAEQQFGKLKGVVLEVERFDDKGIAALAKKLKQRAPKLSAKEEETVRSVMRIGLYQSHGVRLLMAPGARDIAYRQPAMNDLKRGERLSKEWLRKREWPLWLMVWPFSLSNVVEYDFNEIIDFLYLDLFGSYHEKREGVFQSFGLSYTDYLLGMRDEARRANDARAFGVLSLPKGAKEVWRLAVLKGMAIKL
jgi:hypothetical protein